MAEIIPAILTNDISDFKHKYAELLGFSTYFTKLHVDFIDGDFLPDKTIAVKDLVGFRTQLTLIAHLMVGNPKDYFEDAKKVGFYMVIFHLEAFDNPDDIEKTIAAAKALELKVGIAINPETKLFEAAKFIDKVDVIQLMSVHPGAQGRPFEPGTVNKIEEIRLLTKSGIIAVDGGIKVGTIKPCVAAGANWLIAGSSIWQNENRKMAIEALEAETEMQK